MRTSRVFLLLAVLALPSLGANCAHAEPATGNRNPDAPLDPDYPEQNCKVNNSPDCRPSGF
jgi:hypothetical protein